MIHILIFLCGAFACLASWREGGCLRGRLGGSHAKAQRTQRGRGEIFIEFFAEPLRAWRLGERICLRSRPGESHAKGRRALRLFCFQRLGETLFRLICGEVAADGGDYVFLKNFEFQQFVIFKVVGLEIVKGIFNIFRYISASLQFVTLAA